jgi:hypothetical protein
MRKGGLIGFRYGKTKFRLFVPGFTLGNYLLLVRELQLPAFGTDGPGAAAPCYGLPTVDPDSGLAAPGYPAFLTAVRELQLPATVSRRSTEGEIKNLLRYWSGSCSSLPF